MGSETVETIKTRDIVFFELHPDPDQAQTAAMMLTGIAGIIEAKQLTPTRLHIRYDLLLVSLEQIDDALVETGFHLSNTLTHKLRRALYYYTEETERANRGCSSGSCKCTRKVFINRYQQRNHGCQDTRPEHWRRYL